MFKLTEDHIGRITTTIRADRALVQRWLAKAEYILDGYLEKFRAVTETLPRDQVIGFLKLLDSANSSRYQFGENPMLDEVNLVLAGLAFYDSLAAMAPEVLSEVEQRREDG